MLQQYYRMVGANPTPVAWGETPSAIKQGVADALDPSVGALFVFGFKDILSHVTFTQAVPDSQVYSCNLEWFNSMPADVQEGIDVGSEMTAHQNLAKVPSARTYAMAELRKAGVEFHSLSEDQLAEWKDAGGYQRSEWDEFKVELAGSMDDVRQAGRSRRHAGQLLRPRRISRLSGARTRPPALPLRQIITDPRRACASCAGQPRDDMDSCANLTRTLNAGLLLTFYVMLVVTMAIEVLRREVFAYSSIWGEEIVRYSFIYLAWIGAAAAVKERAHIRIDVIMHYLGPRAKALLYMFGDIVMFVVAVIALYWSFEAVHVSWKFGSVTDGLRISKVWFLMAVPIGFGLMIVAPAPILRPRLHCLRDGQARLRRRQAV